MSKDNIEQDLDRLSQAIIKNDFETLKQIFEEYGQKGQLEAFLTFRETDFTLFFSTALTYHRINILRYGLDHFPETFNNIFERSLNKPEVIASLRQLEQLERGFIPLSKAVKENDDKVIAEIFHGIGQSQLLESLLAFKIDNESLLVVAQKSKNKKFLEYMQTEHNDLFTHMLQVQPVEIQEEINNLLLNEGVLAEEDRKGKGKQPNEGQSLDLTNLLKNNIFSILFFIAAIILAIYSLPLAVLPFWAAKESFEWSPPKPRQDPSKHTGNSSNVDNVQDKKNEREFDLADEEKRSSVFVEENPMPQENREDKREFNPADEESISAVADYPSNKHPQDHSPRSTRGSSSSSSRGRK